MTSHSRSSTLIVCATLLFSTLVLAAPVSAQQLLPAVNFRTFVTTTGENWPADFNRDGITDLVGRRRDSGAIQVILGNGDGTFRSPIVSATIGSPVAVGDLNRDRAIDVVAQVGTNLVVLAGNGTGTLRSPRPIIAATATFASVADMNSDGFPDVVLGEEGYSLHIVAGNGNLTFRSPVTLETAAWPHGGFVADFNADGRRDVAVAHRYGFELIVFRNDGGLRFTPLSMPVDRSPTDVTARDLDGDSRLDLVVTARGNDGDGPWANGFVYIYKGNGDGTFAGPTVFETEVGPQSVVVGDFTHDGRVDVATSNHSYSYVDDSCGPGFTGVDTVSILPGTGTMTFGAPTTFALASQASHQQSEVMRSVVRSLNTSDVNRDRFPDLIVGFGKLLVTAAPRANRRPTANAGPNVTVMNDPSVQAAPLHGGGSDPDGHFLTFSWTTNAEHGRFNRDFPHQAAENCFYGFDGEGSVDYGTYTVTLTGDDRHGGIASDSANVTFQPIPSETSRNRQEP